MLACHRKIFLLLSSKQKKNLNGNERARGTAFIQIREIHCSSLMISSYRHRYIFPLVTYIVCVMLCINNSIMNLFNDEIGENKIFSLSMVVCFFASHSFISFDSSSCINIFFPSIIKMFPFDACILCWKYIYTYLLCRAVRDFFLQIMQNGEIN